MSYNSKYKGAEVDAALDLAKTALQESNVKTINGQSIVGEGDIVISIDEEQFMYGIQFDTEVSSPACTRIGNSSLHRTLPIHSKMRGCLLADDGSVTEYLNPRSWEDATRDGSRGQVMVELPMHYRKFETEGTIRRVKISEYPLQGYHIVPKQYVSAYEASLQRSTEKLCSVANKDADYRGGNNTSSYDGTCRSLLGRPVVRISRTDFRNYARKRNTATKEWNCMTYDIQKELHWLFVVEYATLDSQAAYNAAKDSNGFAQGGLGEGVTTWDNTSLKNFNDSNPTIPCGHTDSFGNGTGIVDYDVLNEAGGILHTFSVPRYRGVENPFGHIWKWTDGINVRISPTEENGGDGLSKVYVCSDPAKFNDSNYDGYTHIGNEARTEGFIQMIIFGEGGEIIPNAIGGSGNSYHCDYHYTKIPTTETLFGMLASGTASGINGPGFNTFASRIEPSETGMYYGSRLCFIPAK